MVKTNKYKKGVLFVVQKLSEIRPGVGKYLGHFISERAHFIVQLTNGSFELRLKLARLCEQEPELVTQELLREIKLFSLDQEIVQASEHDANKAWRKLFSTKKMDISAYK